MDTSTNTLYTIPVTTIDNQQTTLMPYQNQVLLIVNLASRCGFTPQYAELERLYRDYKEQGFSVLGFPCNQFRKQEPGSNQDIQTFAHSCFQVSFPLFAKIDVQGPKQAPLYHFLQAHMQKKPWKFIPWNFSKILVDKQGRVLKRYLPTTSFSKIRKEIDALLKI